MRRHGRRPRHPFAAPGCLMCGLTYTAIVPRGVCPCPPGRRAIVPFCGVRSDVISPRWCRSSGSAAITSATSRTVGEAVRIVHEAIDAGINFLDNAWEYHEGESERRMGRAIADRRESRVPDDQGVHARPRREGRDAAARGIAAAPADRLPGSLADSRVRLRQRSRAPFRARRRRRGARAGEERRARCDTSASPATRIPRSTCGCCRSGIPFDACQLPLNGFDASFRSFRAAGAARSWRASRSPPIGMKSLGGDGRAIKKKAARDRRGAALRDEPAGRHDRVAGIDSLRSAAAEPRRSPRLLADDARGEERATSSRLAAEALDGRFELYKTTAEHEGDVGREQHGFPRPTRWRSRQRLS